MKIKCRKVLNKFIAIILIMMLTLADIFAIGIEFATYAIDMVATSSSNVEFEAYFKDKSGEKVTVTEAELQAGSLNVYVDISVRQEGYFNGKVMLENSNFSITKVTQNPYVSNFDGNSVTLNQINSGKTATIEMQVKPKTSATMNADILNKDTQVKLQGTYVSSKGSKDTEGIAVVTAKFVSGDSIKSTLDAQIITNKVYQIDGINKRMVQILVKSKIDGNVYPVKKDTIKLDLPNEAESVEVTARTTKATNPNVIFGNSNYSLSNEKSKLEINVENQQDQNGNISFEQNSKDEFVVTCIYAENKTFENIDLSENNDQTQSETESQNQVTNQIGNQIIAQNTTDDEPKAPIEIAQEIITYDEKTLTQNKKLNIENQIDGILNYELSEQETNIYKGKIYAGEERTYEQNIRTYINSTKIPNNIEFTLEKTNYISGKIKKESKISYKKITIKKEEITKVIGEEGFITIKAEDNTIISNITKETQENSNGYIVINIPENTYKIQIETSKIINAGKIDFKVQKSIKEIDYTKEEIKQFTAIENKIIAKEEEIIKQIELKETTTEAKFELSTTTLKSGENDNVQMKITLLADDESKDLYKNPKLKITFPEEATEVSATYKMLYANGLEKESATLKEEAGKKVLEIKLTGEQQTYPGEVIDGTQILVNANITMNQLMTTAKDKIILTYTNENATNAESGGVVEQEIELIQKQELVEANNNKELGVEPSKITASMEAKLLDDSNYLSRGVIYIYNLCVRNNSSETIENLKVSIKPNELLKINQFFSNEVPLDGILNIEKLNAEEEKNIEIYVECQKKSKKDDKATIYAEVQCNGETYKSNEVTYDVYDISAKATILSKSSSDNDERKVKIGDVITYQINIENTCAEDLKKLTVESAIPNVLSVEKVIIDGKEITTNKETTPETSMYHYINAELDIEAGKSKKIIIMAKVNEILGVLTEEHVNNVVQLKYDSRLINTEIDEAYILDWSVKDTDKNNEDTNKTDNNETPNSNQNTNSDTNQNGENNEGEEVYTIKGKVWLDENSTGDKSNSNGEAVKGVKVKLIEEKTGNNAKDTDGKEILEETNNDGEYTLKNIEKGRYMVVFEYDQSKYRPTEYQKEGVSENNNSDAILRDVLINEKNITIATTDVLNVDSSLSDIDLGLIENKNFDLELTKTVTKITVDNEKGTKEYEIKDKTLAKVEIEAKQLNNSKVTIEYSIKVKNTGDISGYAKSIVDYIPSDIEFNSANNENWRKQGEYLYNTSLENEEIKPGETKEIKLILTKTMTESNTGLVSNLAEIQKIQNVLNINDNDSTPANRKAGEDDMGQADVIIGIKTGIMVRYIMIIVSIMLLGGIGVYLIYKNDEI